MENINLKIDSCQSLQMIMNECYEDLYIHTQEFQKHLNEYKMKYREDNNSPSQQFEDLSKIDSRYESLKAELENIDLLFYLVKQENQTSTGNIQTLETQYFLDLNCMNSATVDAMVSNLKNQFITLQSEVETMKRRNVFGSARSSISSNNELNYDPNKRRVRYNLNEIKNPIEMERPFVTFSPRNPHYQQYSNETRLDYLCRVSTLFQSAINSYNLEKLKYVIYETFAKNCINKPPYLDEFQGRGKIYAAISAVLNCVPDFFIANTKPMYFGRCIVMKQYAYGTTGVLTGLNNSASTDYLWNPFKALPTEKMDEKMKAMKLNYDKWISEGKLIQFVQRCIIFYMLNKELTHIEQRVTHCESFEIFEANVEDFFKD